MKDGNQNPFVRRDQISPQYAKFLKNLCFNEKKLRGDERVVMGENVSAVLQRKLSPKYGDPDVFSISY